MSETHFLGSARRPHRSRCASANVVCVSWNVVAESGVYGTRRDARRLARRLPGSGPMKRTAPRVRRTVASCLLNAATPEFRVFPRTAHAARHEKTAVPGQGTSGVRLVVQPHLAAASRTAASPRTARRSAMRRLGNGSRFALLGARRRLLGRLCSARSERSSEVLFAGVPGPASQLSRFSGPLPPGTRPRHRFGLRLWLHPSSDGAVRQRLDAPSLQFEERVEVEGDGWQRRHTNDSLAVDRLRVGPFGLSSPRRQDAVVWMDAPDLRIATSLAVGQFFKDVIRPSHRRPDFDYQR